MTLPPKGSTGSLGRTSSIAINNNNRPFILSLKANRVIVTAGDILCVNVTYSADLTAINTINGEELFMEQSPQFTPYIPYSNRSLSNPLEMILVLNIASNTSSTPTLTPLALYLTSIQGPVVSFCQTILISDPNGLVRITRINPFEFLNTALLALNIQNRDFAAPEVPINRLNTDVSTVDNTIPYVLSVTSPNISAPFPFGVGDVIDIFVTMSHTVIVDSTEAPPSLRLLLLDETRANATYLNIIPQHPGTFMPGNYILCFLLIFIKGWICEIVLIEINIIIIQEDQGQAFSFILNMK